MSFSSRRRNYLLSPHRRDGLIEWMKAMLQHSFVLDSLETTAADTFEHFEALIEEHRAKQDSPVPSRLMQVVPTVGVFHTPLPLRTAFELYNEKHRLTKRKHIQISFNEIRHILNLAQIMALRPRVADEESTNRRMNPLFTSHSMSASSFGTLSGTDLEGDNDHEDEAEHGEGKDLRIPFNGPKLISFDGDQTLYSDGANFESNVLLAHYLYQLLRHGVNVAVVTAAGYEYNVDKYEYRLSGLLHYFKQNGLTAEECDRFFLFGGECNYLLKLSSEYRLVAVPEHGPNGWMTSTRHLAEAPVNWDEHMVSEILDLAHSTMQETLDELALRGRLIRKRRSVGLVPQPGQEMTRESLDETVLRCQEVLQRMNQGAGAVLPYCAFNGGSDAWVDVGNKRVGVQVLQSYLGIEPTATLHIGDQFLNTGNDFAARAVSPCIWIINPNETTYILKSILRLAKVPHSIDRCDSLDGGLNEEGGINKTTCPSNTVDFSEIERRSVAVKNMDVYTGDILGK